MLPELARMAVILKSQHATSVMTGNYELGYTCGLLSKLSGTKVAAWENAKELQNNTLTALDKYTPADEREKNVIHMLKYYHPDDVCDDQVHELFEMGYGEEHVWQAIVHK